MIRVSVPDDMIQSGDCSGCYKPAGIREKKMSDEAKLVETHIDADILAQKNIPIATADYGTFLLAIPVVSTMLIWFWVSGMNLLQDPGESMTLIMLATVIGTAILASAEASKAGMVTDRQKGSYSPTAWFFLITLLWFVGYPAYLLKRKDYGLKNYLLGGILVALLFIASFAIMDAFIADKKAEVLGNLQHMQQQFRSFGQ